MPALGAVGGAAGASSVRDRDADAVGRSADPRAPGEPRGFAQSWTTTHVEEGRTEVRDLAKRVDGDGAVAVGLTNAGGEPEDERVWLGAVGPDGVAWSTLVGEVTGSAFQQVVADGDRYVVFWDRPLSDTDRTLTATIVSADGGVLSSTDVDATYSFVKDVLVEDDRYVVLGPGTVVSVTKNFGVEQELFVRRPETYDAGITATSLLPVGDGYVLAGDALSPDSEQAFWVVRFRDLGRGVRSNETFSLGETVNAYGAALAGDGRVVLVGEYIQDTRQQAAIAVDPDGSLAWKTVLEEPSGAQFRDAVPVEGGVRAFGFFNYEEPNVVTFDRDGSVRSRWSENVRVAERRPTSVVALGEDRYVVGGRTNSVDAAVETGAWVTRLQPNQPPSPSVSVTPSSPNATEEVRFDGSETTDPDTDVSEFEWNLDDDEYAEEVGETMRTTFPEPGEYEVTLRAIDVYDAVGTRTVSLSVGENTPPSASLSASPSEPFPGDEVELAATELSDAETSVESVTWDVDGDGESEGEGETTTTTFDAPGEYEVAATLADTAGKTATVSTTVTVREPTETPTPTATTAAGTAGDGAGDGGGSGDDGVAPTPGFGATAALAGLSAGALARLLRRD